ncbi:hypothetical protein BGW42_004513 [Actinomortierella wolfii]|nr:hypothetical protein BGW42_004513 [Actinomortierella wolfii]
MAPAPPNVISRNRDALLESVSTPPVSLSPLLENANILAVYTSKQSIAQQHLPYAHASPLLPPLASASASVDVNAASGGTPVMPNVPPAESPAIIHAPVPVINVPTPGMSMVLAPPLPLAVSVAPPTLDVTIAAAAIVPPPPPPSVSLTSAASHRPLADAAVIPSDIPVAATVANAALRVVDDAAHSPLVAPPPFPNPRNVQARPSSPPLPFPALALPTAGVIAPDAVAFAQSPPPVQSSSQQRPSWENALTFTSYPGLSTPLATAVVSPLPPLPADATASPTVALASHVHATPLPRPEATTLGPSLSPVASSNHHRPLLASVLSPSPLPPRDHENAAISRPSETLRAQEQAESTMPSLERDEQHQEQQQPSRASSTKLLIPYTITSTGKDGQVTTSTRSPAAEATKTSVHENEDEDETTTTTTTKHSDDIIDDDKMTLSTTSMTRGPATTTSTTTFVGADSTTTVMTLVPSPTTTTMGRRMA